MPDELLFMFNEDGELTEYKPPFIQIDVETEEDFEHLKSALEHYQRRANWHKLQETKLTKTVECTHCNAEFRFKKNGDVIIDLLPYCPACGTKIVLKNVSEE